MNTIPRFESCSYLNPFYRTGQLANSVNESIFKGRSLPVQALSALVSIASLPVFLTIAVFELTLKTAVNAFILGANLAIGSLNVAHRIVHGPIYRQAPPEKTKWEKFVEAVKDRGTSALQTLSNHRKEVYIAGTALAGVGVLAVGYRYDAHTQIAAFAGSVYHKIVG